MCVRVELHVLPLHEPEPPAGGRIGLYEMFLVYAEMGDSMLVGRKLEVSSREDKALLRDNLIGWIPTWFRHFEKRVEGYYESPADSCKFVLSTAGMDGLHYGKGHFTFAPDEAVVLEFRPPKCEYWSFQIMNNFWDSQDFDVRQVSLNGHQGLLDADGVFRGVISTVDPGVPNWLDPVGHTAGTICGRVLYPVEPPVTTMRTVPLAELRRHLPAGTPEVTVQQRSESLRRRMLAVRRRYRE